MGLPIQLDVKVVVQAAPGSRNELRQRIEILSPGRESRKGRALVLRHLDKALAGDTPSANAIFNLLVKIEPQTSERVARNEALSESDDEIVADFLRRNQPSSS